MKPTAYLKEMEYGENFVSQHKETLGMYTKVIPLYAIPKGYKIVPIEPDIDMQDTGNDYLDRKISVIYKAMIEAAPPIEEI